MTARSASAALVPLDERFPYLMNRLVGQLNHNLAQRLRRHGLTFQHWRVLLVLAMRGPRRMNELVVETIIPQSTLSRLVMRMEAGGRVERLPDAADARSVVVALTPAGREAFDAVYHHAFAEYRRAAQVLSMEEEGKFTETLRRMIAAVCAEPP